MAVSCIISEINRYIDRKSLFFHTPLHSTPSLRGPRRNSAMTFGMEKLEWCGYPTVKKIWRYVYSFWQNVYTKVTDGRTDGQIPHDGIGDAYMHSIARQKWQSQRNAITSGFSEEQCLSLKLVRYFWGFVSCDFSVWTFQREATCKVGNWGWWWRRGFSLSHAVP